MRVKTSDTVPNRIETKQLSQEKVVVLAPSLLCVFFCFNTCFSFYFFGFAGHAGGRYVQKYTWIQGKEIVQLLLKQYSRVYGIEALLAMFERVVKNKARALGRTT